MTVFSRRDSSGFMNELYERCLFCGYTPEQGVEAKLLPQRFTFGGFKNKKKIMMAMAVASIALIAILQVPVPVTVFAFETSIEQLKDVLPYITLVNFTLSDFNVNYSQNGQTLNVSASHASVKTIATNDNITTYTMMLNKLLVHYQDNERTLDLGLASMTLTVKVYVDELLAKIEGTTYLPLWSELLRLFAG